MRSETTALGKSEDERRAIQIGCCSLELDGDGDWILWPPTDVTIFSAPGEGLLVGRCDEETARQDAEKYLAAIEHLDRVFIPDSDGEAAYDDGSASSC